MKKFFCRINNNDDLKFPMSLVEVTKDNLKFSYRTTQEEAEKIKSVETTEFIDWRGNVLSSRENIVEDVPEDMQKDILYEMNWSFNRDDMSIEEFKESAKEIYGIIIH